jgi:glycosyltransferase involved in cell wall biosynthesis
MYLIPIHVPIYVDDTNRMLVTTEWKRSLELLRDSFQGRFGQIVVMAPRLPADSASVEQALVDVSGKADDIIFSPGFDSRCRARDYWMTHRAEWQAQLAGHVTNADLVHAGLDDVYRPISFDGFRAGVRFGKPTVFVQDTDIVIQQKHLAANRSIQARAKAVGYSWVFERMNRWGVARADLSLLKGSALMQRYKTYAKNAKEFHDTSYSAADIVRKEDLERRLATLPFQRDLRFVYCGRLTERKGVDKSLQIIARAAALGVTLQLDIIGDGPELIRLRSLASTLKVDSQIRFLGSLPYGSELLNKLSTYDALLFTPTAEDTPRMIFDGYAGGLPLVAVAIGYVHERFIQERATYLLPRDQIDESAVRLLDLDRNRAQLAELARLARAAADTHSADYWYRQRAEWTIEAVERHASRSR